ncbi:MAG: endonuclease VII domain-containing protein [Pseudomonadota bacterium]
MAVIELHETTHCPKCDLVKEISNFRVRSDTGKRCAICNACWSERCKLYNSRRDPEQVRAFARDYYHRKLKSSPGYAKRQHERRIALRYGLSAGDFAALRDGQGNRCAICETPAPEGKNLYVDHCHETGGVRGLLCGACNLGLGKLGDTLAALRRALRYLEMHERLTVASKGSRAA